MGQITSGIGLISGINFADLIDQLLAIEAKPITIVETRNATLSTQQIALQEINSRLLSFKLSASTLTSSSLINSQSATSSNETALTVSASPSAATGSYGFLVDRLVTNQQVLTRGFADLDNTPLAAGKLTFEFGPASLASDTDLALLNGGGGVARGRIRITDRTGANAEIDLSRALTVNDVLEAINRAEEINVTASVTGDTLNLADTSGGAGILAAADIGSGTTAADLGIAQSMTAPSLSGSQINHLTEGTYLTSLNDGNNVRIDDRADDFQITLKSGTNVTVNLYNEDSPTNDYTAVRTLGDVIHAIHDAAEAAGATGQVTASISANGTGLQLDDSSGGEGTFSVSALNGSKAADDLGIIASTAATAITGGRLIADLNSRLTRYLQGGNGLDLSGTLNITDRSGMLHQITGLAGLETVAEIIAEINTETPPTITAAVNTAGNGISITDTTMGTQDLEIRGSIAESNTLNLAGRYAGGMANSGNLQRQYITEATLLSSLNGGRGITGTRFDITDSAGDTITVDIGQGEKTISDLLKDINFRSDTTIIARINDRGDGIVIEDINAGTRTFALAVTENGSTTAADLGLLGQAATVGGDLDGSFEKTVNIAAVEFLGDNTATASLNGGGGVNIESGLADIAIRTADNTTFTVNFDGDVTVLDILNSINTNGAATASINSAGTGINIRDNTVGTSTLTIADENNSKAGVDLGILGSDNDDDDLIEGAKIIEIPTLSSILTQINHADINISASVINDGTPANPYRLVFASETVGSAGRFVFDDMAELTSTSALDDLHGGAGIGVMEGVDDISITTADSTSFTVNLDGGTSIQDLLTAFNANGAVTASINSAGTGITLQDNTSGGTALAVTALNGSTAAFDLDILQTDNDGDGFIRGGQIARQTLGFDAATLTEASDAVVFYGSNDPAKGVALTSTNNTFDRVIPGLTIDVHAPTKETITVNVTEDQSVITGEISTLVEQFNAVIDTINQHDSYDPETQTRGPLLGDPTIGAIRNLMFRVISGRNTDVSGGIRSLSQIGIRVGSGSKLTFDEAKFKSALADNRDEVEELLTLKATERDTVTGRLDLVAGGVMAQIENLLERFTDGTKGTIQLRVDAIDRQIALGKDRIDGLQDRLDARRHILKAEFLTLERTLATLQNQSSALANLRPITNFSSNRSTTSLF